MLADVDMNAMVQAQAKRIARRQALQVLAEVIEENHRTGSLPEPHYSAMKSQLRSFGWEVNARYEFEMRGEEE